MQPNAVPNYVQSKLIISSISTNPIIWLKTPNPSLNPRSKHNQTDLHHDRYNQTQNPRSQIEQKKNIEPRNSNTEKQQWKRSKWIKPKQKFKVSKLPFQNHEGQRQEGRTIAQKRSEGWRRRGFWSFDPWLIPERECRDRAVGASLTDSIGRWILLFPSFYIHTPLFQLFPNFLLFKIYSIYFVI